MNEANQLTEEFSLATDKRMYVASCIEEFEMLRDKKSGIRGVTMPNPVDFPTDPKKIRKIFEATKGYRVGGRIPSQLDVCSSLPAREVLPPCVKETVRLLEEAVRRATLRGTAYHSFIRQNSIHPLFAHEHGMSGSADMYGGSTLIYEGTEKNPGRSYPLPPRHISVIELPHSAAPPEINMMRMIALRL